MIDGNMVKISLGVCGLQAHLEKLSSDSYQRCHTYSVWSLLFFEVYLRTLRETEHLRAEEGQRARERQNPRQALCC